MNSSDGEDKNRVEVETIAHEAFCFHNKISGFVDEANSNSHLLPNHGLQHCDPHFLHEFARS